MSAFKFFPKIFKWFLFLLPVLILVWIGYSWFTVSNYKILQVQIPTIPDNYKEFRGVVHIHTTYSDGSGSVEDVIEAAQKTNLDFIIITDHNTMGSWDLSQTRKNEYPLLITGNEISTYSGHLLALCLKHRKDNFPANPWEAIDEVIKDNGFTVIAHPTRDKNLWKDISINNFIGIEILNFNSILSDIPIPRILFLLPQGFINEKGLLNSLIDFQPAAINLWDRLNRERAVYGFYGTDAHGPLIAGLPSYEAEFNTASIHLIADQNKNLTKEMVANLLSKGSFYIALDGIAPSSYINFRLVRDGKEFLHMGGVTDKIKKNDRLKFDAAVPRGSEIILLRNGYKLMSIEKPHLDIPLTFEGAYRVEIVIPKKFNPYDDDKLWVITNHIYIRGHSSQ